MLSRGRALPLFGAFVALALCATGVRAQPAPSGKPALDAADSTLVAVAARIAHTAPEVSRIWPGFWPEHQPFVLLRPLQTVLAVSPERPSAEFVAVPDDRLPPELRGRAYLTGYPPGKTENQFAFQLAIQEDTVFAVDPKGRTLSGRLDFYFHEFFHLQHQRRHFVRTPEDRRAARFREPLVDPAHLTPDFAAAAELERAMLLQALDIADPDTLRAHLRRYLAVRRDRAGTLLDVVEVERRMERREGTAQYVGCHAAAAAMGEPPEGAAACIRKELELDLGKEYSNMPEADARIMRWRLYGTGGAIAILLDRLAPDWKPLVQRGMHLDQLLAQAVDFDIES